MMEDIFFNITGEVYVCKNQNGFNAALYDCFGTAEDGNSLSSKKQLREMIREYPSEYPAIVRFVDEVFECSRIHVFVLGNGYLSLLRSSVINAEQKIKDWTK